jgi:hypothetical protein
MTTTNSTLYLDEEKAGPSSIVLDSTKAIKKKEEFRNYQTSSRQSVSPALSLTH